MCQRSLLQVPMKLASFAIEACCVFETIILFCGLTILVDHFKLYLYYELTQLLLIYNSR